VIAMSNATLALPRLALHRETVLALAGGYPHAATRAANKTNGKGCNKTGNCTLFKCNSNAVPC
jgi:hypothetical protein